MIDHSHPALSALLNYHQADEDGVMVVVSRQAIHEAVGYVDALREAAGRVTCFECAGEGVVMGRKCQHCADLRRLLSLDSPTP